jgi:hypothetical protein
MKIWLFADGSISVYSFSGLTTTQAQKGYLLIMQVINGRNGEWNQLWRIY